MKRQAILGISILLTALTGACGGGGGGGGSNGGGVDDRVRIGEANAVPVAENAAGGAMALDNLAFINEGTMDSVLGTAQPQRAARTRTGSFPLRVYRSAGQLGGTETVACESGTGQATVRVDDIQPLDELSDGDTGSITYESCLVQGRTLNGSILFEVLSNDNFPAAPFDFVVQYTLDNLSAALGGQTETIDGSFAMTASSPDRRVFQTSLSGGPLTYSSSAAGETTVATFSNFSAGVTQNDDEDTRRLQIQDARLSIQDNAGNETMNIETTQSLDSVSGHRPHAGEILVTGASSHLWVQPLNDSDVLIWVDADGDREADGTSIQTTWSVLGF